MGATRREVVPPNRRVKPRPAEMLATINSRERPTAQGASSSARERSPRGCASAYVVPTEAGRTLFVCEAPQRTACDGRGGLSAARGPGIEGIAKRAIHYAFQQERCFM